jgi:hypothetical protein
VGWVELAIAADGPGVDAALVAVVEAVARFDHAELPVAAGIGPETAQPALEGEVGLALGQPQVVAAGGRDLVAVPEVEVESGTSRSRGCCRES